MNGHINSNICANALPVPVKVLVVCWLHSPTESDDLYRGWMPIGRCYFL